MRKNLVYYVLVRLGLYVIFNYSKLIVCVSYVSYVRNMNNSQFNTICFFSCFDSYAYNYVLKIVDNSLVKIHFKSYLFNEIL